MSNEQVKEKTPEQQIKNLEYKLDRVSRVLEITNESLTKMQNEIKSTREYSIRMQIESLNKELVEITSSIIQKPNENSELLIKQAYLTGKLQILNVFDEKYVEMNRQLNNLIITTNQN